MLYTPNAMILSAAARRGEQTARVNLKLSANALSFQSLFALIIYRGVERKSVGSGLMELRNSESD